MNKTKLALACALAMAFGSTAYAQTCTSPTPFNTPAGGPTASGDTCGAPDEIPAYCVLQDSVGKPDVIYSLSLAAPGADRTATQITINGNAAGFTPTIYIYSDACIQAKSCAQTGTQDVPADLTTVAAGTYFMAVSASQIDASGACGPYNLAADGTLPVELQNYSVN